MSYYFTDQEISSLISEEKIFPGSPEEIMSFKESDGHKKSFCGTAVLRRKSVYH